MLDINNYIGKKVYIQIDTPTTPNEENEPDEVKGEILMSIDDVLGTAEPEDEFIEVTITKSFVAIDKCLHLLEVENGIVIDRIPTKLPVKSDEKK